MKWELVDLGDVCEIVRGGSPRPIIDYITEDEDGRNWLKIGDVGVYDKYFRHSKEKIKLSGIKKTREVVAGDLILSNSMSFGRAFITLIDGYIHDGWLRLRPDEKVVYKEYLYYFLTSDIVQSQFKAIATGSVVSNLKVDTVKTIKVHLPHIKIQKKIADYLDVIDSKIETNKEINNNLSPHSCKARIAIDRWRSQTFCRTDACIRKVKRLSEVIDTKTEKQFLCPRAA